MSKSDYEPTAEEEAIARLLDCPQRHCPGIVANPCRFPSSGRVRSAHSKRVRAAQEKGLTLADVPAETLSAPATRQRRNPWREEGNRAWIRRTGAP